MCLSSLLDFMIIGLVNVAVLLLVALWLTYVDFKEDQAYYENLKYKKRGEKWNS